MVIKESKTKAPKINVGDLIEVVRKDDRKFNCIVVENYRGGFVGKIISKDEGIGAGSWKRYNLNHDGRFQTLSECKSIKVLSHATKTTAKSSFSLNESLVAKHSLVYYETPLNDGNYATFCVCEGFGGWSFHKQEDTADSLKESYFNSQLSKLKTLRESVRH